MRSDTQPAFARRIRLSTAGITAAVTVTCLALLAIAVAVGPAHNDADSSVSFEAPEASNRTIGITPVVFSSSTVRPVSGPVAGSVSTAVAGN